MGTNLDVASIDAEIAALQEQRERAIAAKKIVAAKYPPAVNAVLMKWIGNDFDTIDGNGGEVTKIKIVNGDIAVLIGEIDRLMAENDRLRNPPEPAPVGKVFDTTHRGSGH